MLSGYCVRRAGDPPPDQALRGVEGRPVRLLEAEGLGLWLSDGAPPPAQLERLREHDAVVRAALRSATPLPLRYGTAFRDEASAAEALAARRSDFLASLERVAGRVEMGVQLLWDAHEGIPESREAVGSGTAFLALRRRELMREEARRREAESLLARVSAFFRPLEPPTVTSVLPAAGVAGTLAHLVQRAELSRYRSCASEAGRAVPRVHLRVTGPWAPYSFVQPPR